MHPTYWLPNFGLPDSCLPISTPPQGSPKKTMAPMRLLFVDDEPAIRLTLPLILEKEGFQVTTAATVQEALELINRERFEILISDLNIGQAGDGFTIVSVMRRVQ